MGYPFGIGKYGIRGIRNDGQRVEPLTDRTKRAISGEMPLGRYYASRVATMRSSIIRAGLLGRSV